MTEELKNKIEMLRAVAPKLNASTTEAGKVIQEVEGFLESLGIGTPAGVCFDAKPHSGDEGEKLEDISFLCYERFHGKYRIAVVVKTFADDDGVGSFDDFRSDDGGTLWGSCPRSVKLESFAKLPELLDEIVTEANRLADLADATVEKVRSVIGNVGPVDQSAPTGDPLSNLFTSPLVKKRATKKRAN